MGFRWVAAFGIALLAGTAWAEEAVVLKTQKDKVSYGIGMSIGKNLKRDAVDVDADLVSKGMRDAFSGEKTLMSEEEYHAAMTALQKDLMEKQAEAIQKLAEKNKKEGEAFLAENGKKEGVVTLPSGLQYKAIRSGKGKTPALADTVETHYRGTLIDGTEFDSSYKRGQTVTFPLYVAVDLLKRTPVIEVLGGFFAPVMGLFGLPGEAAFAFIAAFLLNLYAAIAILVPLHLDAFQVTQCGLMMGVAHNLVVEGGVLKSTGARGGFLTLCRFCLSAASGLAFHIVHRMASG